MVFGNYIQAVVQKYSAWKNKRFINGVLNDNHAVFSSFGQDVYVSDIVNNCIDRIATEISKLSIMSVVDTGDQISIQNDDITRLFRFKPNPLQTTKDFLAACVWLQRKDMHCFIYPEWETVTAANGASYRRYTALWPLNPASVDIGRDESGTIWLIKFQWQDGSSDILPYDDVVHMKWRRGKNMVVGGGNDQGQADTKDMYKAVTALDKIMQGLPLSIESSMKMNGVFTSKTKVDADKLTKLRDEFEGRIHTSSLGIAAVDIAGDFIPVNNKQPIIPESTMSFVKSIIRQRYGVSTAILDGDYNDEQHAAFYQNCLEDFIEEFQQAFSSALFTQREQDVGHRVRCYYNKVEYYSTANKILLAQVARETGLMTINQMADMFGMEPFEGGDRRLQSLNFVNINLIDDYQKSAKGVSDEKASEEDS